MTEPITKNEWMREALSWRGICKEREQEIERLEEFKSGFIEIDDLFEEDHPELANRVKLLFARAESAESEAAALREQIGEVRKHPMGQSVLRIIEAAPHHPDCQLQTKTGLWQCHPSCRAILDDEKDSHEPV